MFIVSRIFGLNTIQYLNEVEIVWMWVVIIVLSFDIKTYIRKHTHKVKSYQQTPEKANYQVVDRRCI